MSLLHRVAERSTRGDVNAPLVGYSLTVKLTLNPREALVSRDKSVILLCSKRVKSTVERFRTDFWEVIEEWSKIENFLNGSERPG
jgi:hypothetical protein